MFPWTECERKCTSELIKQNKTKNDSAYLSSSET